jgi:Glycosyltransferase family 87
MTVGQWRHILVGILLIASVLQFAVRGPLRLLHGGTGWNDFLSPYIQAKAWMHGDDPYSAQSLVKWWPPDNPRPPFVDVEAATGKLETKRGMPSPYPLTSLVLISSFAALPWQFAVSLWDGLSVAAVIIAALALLTIGGCCLSEMRSQVFLAATSALAPLHTGLATANPAVLAVSLTAAALWASHTGRKKTAGILLAVAICLKPTVAGGLLLYYLVRRYWSIVVTTCAAAAAIGLIGSTRLALAGVQWIPSYLENSRRMFAVGSVDDFTNAASLRFNMINSQVFFSGFFSNASISNLLSRVLAVMLLGCWIWLCFRRRTSSGLLEVSAISILSLIAVYHRFYDATLLTIPLAWSLLIARKRSALLATLATIAPFFVPGSTMLADLAGSGRIPASITSGWWWNAVVLPHEAWDLILMAFLFLYFMWCESAEKPPSTAWECVTVSRLSQCLHFMRNCLFHRRSDIRNGLLRKFRINRQRQHLPCCSFRLRERSFAVSEVCVGGLQVCRYSIVNRGLNTFLTKCGLQAVAIFGTKRVDVIDMACPGHFDGQFQAAVGEQAVVLICH